MNKKVYNIGQLRQVIREAKNEFKPVYGKDVESANKKINSEAYATIDKETKAYDGGLTKSQKKKESATMGMNRGMGDLEFDAISTPFKEKVKSQLKGYVSADAEKEHKNDEFGNASFNDGIEKAVEDHAKEAKKAHDDSKTDGLVSSKHKKEIEDSKSTMFESKTISRIHFKNTQFLSEGHMLSKVPDDFKVEGKKFIMKDTADNEYLVEWTNKKPNVTKRINKTQVNEEMNRIKQLYNYKSKDYFTSTNAQSRVNENKEFSDVLNRARQLMK